MQIERLLRMIMILLSREQVTAKKLADEFNVSVRTIYRDLDVLSLAGIPVYTSRGRGGGIKLLSEFTISRALLSIEEQQDIMSALRGMKAVGGMNIEGVLDKVGAIFKSADDSWLEIDMTDWGNDKRNQNKFADIRYAIAQKKVVEFRYVDSYGGKSLRQVEPLRLVYKGSAWYLMSYCRVKSDYRNFRLSRMSDLKLTDESFDRSMPEGASINMPVKDMSQLIELKLRFGPKYAYRVYDDFPYEDIVQNEDGTMDVRAWYPRGEWVYGYVMSFGDGVRILEPADFKDEICGRMKSALSNYADYPDEDTGLSTRIDS